MSSETDQVERTGHHGRPSIDFTVDGETFTTDDPELTPRQIMAKASVDHATHYLVQIEGRHRESYQGKEDVPIRLHEHAKFITVSTGPTPVS